MRFLTAHHDKNKLKENTKGFTLVELLVIIAILGILAAILMPSLLGFIDRHKEQQVITECRSVVLTAQSMLAESYEYGKAQPSKSDILTESGLDEGSITHLELNSGSIKDSTDLLLHLTYVDKGITVTYCRDYLTAGDGHDDLYTLSDGPDGDGSWSTNPTPSTEVDSETETETETEPATETPKPNPGSGQYIPVAGKKFEYLGDFNLAATEIYKNNSTEWPASEKNVWDWPLDKNTIYSVSSDDGLDYFIYTYSNSYSYQDYLNKAPYPTANTVVINTSKINLSSDCYETVTGDGGYVYYKWLVDINPGDVYQDADTLTYYVYIGAAAKAGSVVDNNICHNFTLDYAWRDLTLYMGE